MTTYTICDSESGNELVGTVSDDLAEASREAGETGIVHAYRDGAGVWQYLRSDEVSDAAIPGWLPSGSSEAHTVYVEQIA